MPSAVFVGVCTLDLIYLIANPLTANTWQQAVNYQAVAGGGATNAAITFAALGGHPTLVTAIGQGPIGDLIRAELAHLGVDIVDTTPNDPAGPPLASCLITQDTGERTIISRGASTTTPALNLDMLRQLLTTADVLMVDDYRPTLAVPAANTAHAAGIPVILDATTWHPHTPALLKAADFVITSEHFTTPHKTGDTLDRVLRYGPIFAATTAGPQPVRWKTRTGHGFAPVPTVHVVDTLGAGDIMHGAFTHTIATHLHNREPLTDITLENALTTAARTASTSCETFGTRDWITTLHHPVNALTPT